MFGAGLDVVLGWLDRFRRDADLQAGRPVHLSGLNPISFGAQRIGPVSTPPERRGHGWATATIAALCRQVLDAGARPCLFTDQANPVSTHLYTALGFDPVVDMVNLRITPHPVSQREP